MNGIGRLLRLTPQSGAPYIGKTERDLPTANAVVTFSSSKPHSEPLAYFIGDDGASAGVVKNRWTKKRVDSTRVG
jgi:hypothetical protein